MVPELLAIYRAHGIPTWEDRVANVVAGIVSTYRRTERDRLAEVASSQRSYSPDDQMTRAEVATFKGTSPAAKSIVASTPIGKVRPPSRNDVDPSGARTRGGGCPATT